MSCLDILAPTAELDALKRRYAAALAVKAKALADIDEVHWQLRALGVDLGPLVFIAMKPRPPLAPPDEDNPAPALRGHH